MYLGNNYFFPCSLSLKRISLTLSLSLCGGGTRCWSIGVPGLWPSPHPGVLPDLERERDMEMGWGWSTACPALFPDGCCGRSPSLSHCPLFLLIHLLFFYASNQTLSHMHALSHSLVHVNSAVQLTADQYEKCYENDITHEQLTAIGDPSCFMLIRDV